MEIAPLIEDGDIMLGESGAIVEYIVGKYAPKTELVRYDTPKSALRDING